MGTKVITVRVGVEPAHVDFTVHEDLVRKSSAFFEAALGREWLESKERMVRLPEYAAKDFMIYVQWLYSERLHMSPDGGAKEPTESTNLMKGYLLGDYLQDTRYKDTLMDALIEWGWSATEKDYAAIVSNWAYAVLSKTPKDCPLRKFLVDLTVWHTTSAFWVSSHQGFSNEFVAMVSVGFSTRCNDAYRVSPLRTGAHGYCSYHCHGDKQCYKTGSKE